MTGRQRGDGDGWVNCEQGHRHWGLFGAAGLLVHRPIDDGAHEVLLQHRAEWSHFGGTWGLLGGARTSTESAVHAALREAAEEGAVAAERVLVHGRYDEAHGGWSYATVLAGAGPGLEARPSGGESIDVAWHRADGIMELPLHPGFAGSWPVLRQALAPLTVVVDAANVVGSRPDGWWKDRAGAARRLVSQSAAAGRRGLSGGELPRDPSRPELRHWWPQVVVVVEGAARPAVDAGSDGVTVVAAAGSGDDTIVDRAATAASAAAPVVVVTADRELRGRCTDVGAVVAGPRWWLQVIS